MADAFLHRRSIFDKHKDSYSFKNPIKQMRVSRSWNNPITRHKREKSLHDWANSFAGKRHYRKLSRHNALHLHEGNSMEPMSLHETLCASRLKRLGEAYNPSEELWQKRLYDYLKREVSKVDLDYDAEMYTDGNGNKCVAIVGKSDDSGTDYLSGYIVRTDSGAVLKYDYFENPDQEMPLRYNSIGMAEAAHELFKRVEPLVSKYEDSTAPKTYVLSCKVGPDDTTYCKNKYGAWTDHIEDAWEGSGPDSFTDAMKQNFADSVGAEIADLEVVEIEKFEDRSKSEDLDVIAKYLFAQVEPKVAEDFSLSNQEIVDAIKKADAATQSDERPFVIDIDDKGSRVDVWLKSKETGKDIWNPSWGVVTGVKKIATYDTDENGSADVVGEDPYGSAEDIAAFFTKAFSDKAGVKGEAYGGARFGKYDIVQALAKALHNDEDDKYSIRYFDSGKVGIEPGYAYASNKEGEDAWKVLDDGTVEFEFAGKPQGKTKIDSLSELASTILKLFGLQLGSNGEASESLDESQPFKAAVQAAWSASGAKDFKLDITRNHDVVKVYAKGVNGEDNIGIQWHIIIPDSGETPVIKQYASWGDNDPHDPERTWAVKDLDELEKSFTDEFAALQETIDVGKEN